MPYTLFSQQNALDRAGNPSRHAKIGSERVIAGIPKDHGIGQAENDGGAPVSAASVITATRNVALVNDP